MFPEEVSHRLTAWWAGGLLTDVLCKESDTELEQEPLLWGLWGRAAHGARGTCLPINLGWFSRPSVKDVLTPVRTRTMKTQRNDGWVKKLPPVSPLCPAPVCPTVRELFRCMSPQAYAQFAGAPLKLRKISNPWRSPSGEPQCRCLATHDRKIHPWHFSCLFLLPKGHFLL